MQEIVVSRGKILELLRPDANTGKVHTLLTVEVFGIIRSLMAFRLTGGTKGLLAPLCNVADKVCVHVDTCCYTWCYSCANTWLLQITSLWEVTAVASSSWSTIHLKTRWRRSTRRRLGRAAAGASFLDSSWLWTLKAEPS